jgi:RHS repeat-associated protein
MGIKGEWKFVQPQIGGVNAYQYNGKELNEDFGLNWNDYGARWYDASIARWNGVDQLSEKYSSMSPYNYVANNPLKFIDPDGRDIIIAWEADGKTHTAIYSYKENRALAASAPEFVKNTIKSLDQLYSTGASDIVMKEGEGSVDIIDAFMGNKEHNITIKKGKKPTYGTCKK